MENNYYFQYFDVAFSSNSEILRVRDLSRCSQSPLTNTASFAVHVSRTPPVEVQTQQRVIKFWE
jgi:hypothetical protein